MKYYKAISERYDWFNKNRVLENELLTEKERNTRVRYITDFWFQVVDVKKVIIIDGRRFEAL